MRIGLVGVMAVLWTGLFLSVLASTHIGALIVGDTLPFTLITFGLLFMLWVVVPLAATVLSILRRGWRPLLFGLANLPASLLVLYLALALQAPSRALIDRVRGEPVLVARYVGTQNSATLTLRKDSRMDVFWSAWPGVVRYYGGTWEMQGAALRLHFEGRDPPLGERVQVGAEAITFVAARDGHSRRFVIEGKSPR